VVRLIEPQTEADPLAVLVQVLTMFGSAVGRKAHWRVEETTHYANLYCCLVGETAKGRKGTAKDRALRVFDYVEGGWHQRIISGLSSGEGLIQAVRDEVWHKEPVKQKGRVVDYQDVLADEGVADKRLLVIEPEFGRVLRTFEREGNTLSARLREGWDSGNLISLTKACLRATGVHLSLVGHITRAELARLLAEVETANGLANRFLWLAVRRSKLLPLGGERIDLGSRAHKVALAVEQAQSVGEMPFDQQASDFWCEVYPRLTAGAPGILGAVTNRAEAQVRRLAILYALLDFHRFVALPHLLAALALWDYCERSCHWIFGGSTGDSVADEILLALHAAGDKGLTGAEISAVFGRHEKSARLGQALATLAECGLAHPCKTPTAGRPVVRWFAGKGAKKAQEAKETALQEVAPGAAGARSEIRGSLAG